MNRNMVRRVATLVAMTCIVSSETALATGCESAASRIGSDIGKNMGIILVAAGCTAATAGNWQACYASATAWEKIVEQSIEYWNAKASGSSWTIGPRPIVLNRWEEGTLVSTGGRIFVTTTTIPTSSCKVVIKETGGKGKVGGAICRIDSDGDMDNLKEFTINETRSEKKDKSQDLSYTVSGVQNKVLQVHMDGKSVGNTFSYKIMLIPQ